MPKLTNIEPIEVSFVRRPAIRRKFLLLKEVNELEELKNVLDLELENEGKVEEVLKAKNLSDKAKEAAKGALKILLAFKDEFPKDILDILGKLAGYSESEQYGYPEPQKKEELPPEIKKKLDALWKEKELLQKQLEEEKEKRIMKEFEERASQFSNLPLPKEKIAVLLRKTAELGEEVYKDFETILKSLDEQLKQNLLFKEQGKSLEGASSAWSKIEQLANTIIEKNAGFTKEQAIRKVIEENPELYLEYQKEVKNK